MGIGWLASETRGFHGRLLLARLLLAPLPIFVGSRLRSEVLRRVGFRIGEGSSMAGLPVITGSGQVREKLAIGRSCWFNIEVHLELNSTITIGDGVSLGQQVMILTSTHDYQRWPTRRAGALLERPVAIGDGCWLGARCLILPGVALGDGAVVAAGAVVTKDVPPHTLVAGIPARPLRQLPS
jgi:acetyltransferase-like isoleucine patch superfamily enzyme